MTETELSAVASAAMVGLNIMPRQARDIAPANEKRAEDQRRLEELQVIHWMRSPACPATPMPVPAVTPPPPPLSPACLIVVDEADRLRVSSLEQPRWAR
jgi:hypothetical protein